MLVTAEAKGVSKAARQNRFLTVVSGSEPPDMAGFFPLLFNVIGDASGQLRTSRFCCGTDAQSSRPSIFAQAIRVP
ncbi:hypothetical protein [Bradyrhizobium sp. AZCC 2230]|uniref:hypothetical protein n=1 Tax=Bradyrhizobium sp. AZCC 2230 TaxID=3117021 RepID=UPI002FEF903C